MPPLPDRFDGLEEIAPLPRWRSVAGALAAPAFARQRTARGGAATWWDAGRSAYVFHGIDVLTFRGTRIAAITAFLHNGLFADFGLPDELPA